MFCMSTTDLDVISERTFKNENSPFLNTMQAYLVFPALSQDNSVSIATGLA